MPSPHGELVARVAKAIGAARRSKGLSQEGLAASLDIAVKNVQRIESGRQNLSLRTIERICVALDVPPEQLFVPKLAVEAALPSVIAKLEGAGYVVRRPTGRGRRPANAVPVMTLQAAAGKLAGEARAIEVLGWVQLPDARANEDARFFVAEIRGSSMEPRVPDGSVVLFGPAHGAPTRGRVLLLAHEVLDDGELGGPYALKKIHSVRRLTDGRTRVELASTNAAYPMITIDAAEGELRVIAEILRVIVAPGQTERSTSERPGT